MRKSVWMLLMAGCMTVLAAVPALAGQWQEDGRGWKYEENDGTAAGMGWKWIDGNQDGIAECYYFGADGYCLQNTVTPDGYTVGPTGAWLKNGSVVTRSTAEMVTSDGIAVDMGEYILHLPKTWEGHYQVEEPRAEWGNSVIYSPISKYPEQLFYISKYKTMAEVDEIRGYVDNLTMLGQHGGYYYLMGRPTDTALEFYSEADRQMVFSMMQDYSWIAGNIEFKN